MRNYSVSQDIVNRNGKLRAAVGYSSVDTRTCLSMMVFVERYKAIIFDVGGVLFTYTFDNAFRYWAQATDKDFFLIKKRFRFDETYEKFERGEILPDRFREHVRQLLDIELDDTEFDNGWNSILLEEIPDIEGLLKSLSRNYRLVTLSNTNIVQAEVGFVRFKHIFDCFEKLFCSYQIHARKPEPESYNIVLDYLKVPAGATLFLDDNESFVKGAKSVGINAIHCRSTAQLLADFKRLEILF